MIFFATLHFAKSLEKFISTGVPCKTICHCRFTEKPFITSAVTMISMSQCFQAWTSLLRHFAPMRTPNYLWIVIMRENLLQCVCVCVIMDLLTITAAAAKKCTKIESTTTTTSGNERCKFKFCAKLNCAKWLSASTMENSILNNNEKYSHLQRYWATVHCVMKNRSLAISTYEHFQCY